MKVFVDRKQVFELSDIQIKCIQNDISVDKCMQDLERRLCHVLQHKYEQCFVRLKEEWMPKLAERGYKTIPLDDEEFCKLVFSQEDYKDKATRDKETVK